LQGPWAMAIFGLAIIVIMRWMPDGLAGLAKSIAVKVSSRKASGIPDQSGPAAYHPNEPSGPPRSPSFGEGGDRTSGSSGAPTASVRAGGAE
jgi:hypothetical protein